MGGNYEFLIKKILLGLLKIHFISPFKCLLINRMKPLRISVLAVFLFSLLCIFWHIADTQ